MLSSIYSWVSGDKNPIKGKDFANMLGDLSSTPPFIVLDVRRQDEIE